jgi:hypothetical protein
MRIEINETIPNHNPDLVVVDFMEDPRSADGATIWFEAIVGWKVEDNWVTAVTPGPVGVDGSMMIYNTRTQVWHDGNYSGRTAEGMLETIYEYLGRQRPSLTVVN